MLRLAWKLKWLPLKKLRNSLKSLELLLGMLQFKEEQTNSFWSERLRESKYDINEEELRPYFSLPKVMDGLFSLAKTLFDIDVEAADGLAPVWNIAYF
ncbi:hypothetical protein MKW98_014024 [Papaver atlanticum]|uniref:Peptidase M3A/M3B catalytic domain-containing protein n=1 Tax=Papaver atlanticum TaxID=357466 RepID=A0AAD4SII2_9MAGN|nr:hypothetical protein MKW98_014024 [Papaver atlanticum]